MTRITIFNSLRRVVVRISLVLFICAFSLAHAPTAVRLAGAPSVTAAQLRRGFPALARQGQNAPATVTAAGDLDLTFAGFGNGGIVVTPGQITWLAGMVLQPDGKIVVAAADESNLIVKRYLSNGVLDTTFGNSGTSTIPEPAVGFTVSGIAFQPADGKIVLVGTTDGRSDFVLTRLTATGTLDTAFGSQGFVTTNFQFGASTDSEFAIDRAYAVLVQTDGKIVAVGKARIDGDYDFAAARYYYDGSLDTTFGGDGRVTIGFGGSDQAHDIAQQADGKLVLFGRHNGNSGGHDYFALARLNSNGTLDGNFNGGGKVTTDMGGFFIDTYAVALQPNGKIVAAGDNFDTGGIVARYNADGSLDNTFDGNGKLGFGPSDDQTFDVAVQPDGKIVLLGEHTSPDGTRKFIFYRRNVDGSPDTTFAGVGDVAYAIGQSSLGQDLALLPDGRILGLGLSDQQVALVRLWPNGSLDAGGQQTLSFEDPLWLGSREQASAQAIQPDGKTIVVGSVANTAGTERDLALARFLPDGQPDHSFGTRGLAKFNAVNEDFARAVALQPDGKIVVAGYLRSGSVVNFMIARFLGNGQIDTTFGIGGFNAVDFFTGDDYGQALALTPDGKLVVAGVAWLNTRYIFAVARFNSNGSLDTAFGSSGKQVYNFGQDSWASSVVVQRDRKIVVGGSAGPDFAMVRFQESGSLDSFGPNGQGRTITDMGGTDFITALAITPSGEFYAAGGRNLNGNDDFALAHYGPNGVLVTVTCNRGDPCPPWATGMAFVDWGGSETATSIDVRSDGQIVVAGCVGGQLGWAQFSPTSTTPLRGTTDLASTLGECACGVQFAAPNKLLVAGTQYFNNDANLALARFETTTISPTFADVPTSHGAWQYIEAVYDFAITLGCQTNPRQYCPDSSVTREQMAAFIIRSLHLPGYVPPQPATQRFSDVPSSSPFYAHIEEMAVRQITSGCGGGKYCPTDPVTREQMAIFVVRALGFFNPPTPATATFADVPNSGPTEFSHEFVEKFVELGITSGCQAGPPRLYCPTAPVTRGQMAVFLARAFNLPLP
jgi:uncharacterized delta-60 repeat protein